MKTKLVAIISIILLSIGFSACTEEEVNPQNLSKQHVEGTVVNDADNF